MDEDRQLSTSQAAKILHCSRQHVVSLCEGGLLPFVRVGTHRRINRSYVEQLVQPVVSEADARALWLHHAIAAKLVADPDGVLAFAATRLHRRGRSSAAASLAAWKRLLAAGPEAVLEAVTAKTPLAAELRTCSPLLGLLTPAERRTLLESFTASRAHTSVAS
jgi:excisionase family DNA binding protein